MDDMSEIVRPTRDGIHERSTSTPRLSFRRPMRLSSSRICRWTWTCHRSSKYPFPLCSSSGFCAERDHCCQWRGRPPFRDFHVRQDPKLLTGSGEFASSIVPCLTKTTTKHADMIRASRMIGWLTNPASSRVSPATRASPQRRYASGCLSRTCRANSNGTGSQRRRHHHFYSATGREVSAASPGT